MNETQDETLTRIDDTARECTRALFEVQDTGILDLLERELEKKSPFKELNAQDLADLKETVNFNRVRIAEAIKDRKEAENNLIAAACSPRNR